MATITTTTQTDVVAYPNLGCIARDMVSGFQYVVVQTAAQTLQVFRSTDNGSSWSAGGSFNDATMQADWSSFIVDKAGYGHLLYRRGTSGGGGTDNLCLRRYNLSTQAWGGLAIIASVANGGTIGTRYTGGVEVACFKPSTGNRYLPWVAGYSNGAGSYGIQYGCVRQADDGVVTIANTTITGTRDFISSLNPSGHMGPSMEIQHNGDGITSSTPHLWVAYGRTRQNYVRSAWNGSGWTNPSSATLMVVGAVTQDYCVSRWDGVRWLNPIINPLDTTTINIYQRDAANTTTTVVTTPTHPTGIITDFAVSYDNTTKDIKVFAVGTSTDVLYHVSYSRVGASWGSWTTVTATAVLNSGREWGVRRGGSAGNARYDIVTAHSGAPNTIVNTQQTLTTPPSVATWDTSASAYMNNGAADVNAGLLLDWTFTDADPGQTQGSYALSRQIGAGAIQYYTAAGGTWGGVEVQNSSGTSAVTLASGWGAGTDANHTYKVKVWDSGGTPAAGYSDALTLIPSVKVNPTITAPTAAQVIATDHVTVTWTVSEQTAFRIRLLTNPGGLQVYDSGFQVSTDLTFIVPYTLANGTGWTVELTTRNLEGLSSTSQTVNFTVSYLEPPGVRSVFTPQTSLGLINVAPTSLAPVSPQPSITTMELWRRPAITPTLNSNPDFNGSTSGFFIGGGGTGTLSYSTTQFVTSPGAARYVPAVADSASPSVESNSVAIVAGNLYLATGWIRPDTNTKSIFVQLNWYTSGNVYISSTQLTIPAGAPAANAWHFMWIKADPSQIATAAKVSVGLGRGGTPAAADAFYVDEERVRVFDPTEGVRLRASTLDAVDDWGVVSAVDYEYRWVATGSNGTTSFGPWMA